MSMLRVWPLVAPWLVGVCEPVWLSMVPPMVLPSDLPIMVDDREVPGGSVAVILCHKVHCSDIQAAPHIGAARQHADAILQRRWYAYQA